MESGAFMDAIRWFFAVIVKFLYKFFAGAIDLMYQLAELDFGLDGYIDAITEKIFNILIIFMLFRITISFLNYLVTPDTFTDSGKGAQNIIKRVIIAVVTLISINPLFTLLTDLQADILNADIITSILGDTKLNNVLELTSDELDDKYYAYGVRMHPECDEGKLVYTFSKGDHIALLLLKPFIQPYSADEITAENYEDAIEKINEPEGYCGVKKSDLGTLVNISNGGLSNTKETFRLSVAGPNSAEGYMYKKYYAAEDKNGVEANTYIFDFNFLLATVCGFIAILIVINFCFDIVIRSCTLLMLKMLAPIPVVSYISPQGKSSEMLGTWGKKVASTWVSLFIRIAVLSIAISFIGAACDALSDQESTFLMQIFVIIGILMFAKKLPGLIEELIPGLKLSGGFELNPLKRIKNNALGGEYISGGIAAAGNLALQSGIQAGSNALAFGRNKHLLKKQMNAALKSGDKEKAAQLQRKLNRMKGGTGWLNLGSTIAGGALRGAYLGAGSGFKTGQGGSANIFKNVKSDTEKGNRSRNNSQNVFNFNSQLKEDLKSKHISKADYKQQRYTWGERNIVEPFDRNLGIKTEYGGYGYYDKKIGDLKKSIENIQLQERAVRDALANAADFNAQLEEVRKLMNDKGMSESNALTKVATDFKLSGQDLIDFNNEYTTHKRKLESISYFDNQQKKEKAEMKAYEQMLEARESVKKS